MGFGTFRVSAQHHRISGHDVEGGQKDYQGKTESCAKEDVVNIEKVTLSGLILGCFKLI